jgi:flagellar biosynthesis protein FlhF
LDDGNELGDGENKAGAMTEQSSTSMKIKSYFASSVEQAIQSARQELGIEAMLITSRRSSPESRHLGAYEVVFGLHEPAARARPTAQVPAADLASELQNLRTQLQEIKSTLQGARTAEPASSEAEELFDELVAADLASTIARDTVSGAVRLRDQLTREQTLRERAAPSLPLQAYAAELISKQLRFAPPFQQPASEVASVVAFAGPPGAGKTTTLIKIAIRECLAHRVPVRILSVDPSRVAAHEKLRSFAAIIGVAFSAISSVQEFVSAVEESRSKGVVLVDTPGFSPAEMEGAKEIASCLERVPNKFVHLVLPASMKRADLTRYIRDYSGFQPDYLLFTKLDETESQGAILSAALEADKPLSFLASGQNIPEDIEAATARVLLQAVFRTEIAEAVSAA